MANPSNSQFVRRSCVAVILVGCLAARAAAQSPVNEKEHRGGDAVVGALLGGAAGAVIGLALGSLAGEEPSCVSSPCKGHSYAKQGTRVGLVIGTPVGAIIGWRGAFRRAGSAHDLVRTRFFHPPGQSEGTHSRDGAGEREHRGHNEHVPAGAGGQVDDHGKQKPAERSPAGEPR